MAKRTIDNCSIKKRNIKLKTEEMICTAIGGKCSGIKHHENETEVIEPCKHCKLCIAFEGYDDLRFSRNKK